MYPSDDELRAHCLGHLTDVVMVSADTLSAERLGGADYDGNLIKTIADPILNRCVKRNYEYDVYQKLSNNTNLPLLKIPSLSAPQSGAGDWRARFCTVGNTFAARIGQICNAAMDRTVVAYSVSADPEERKRYCRGIEMLGILSGLEIDAAKIGIRPDLDEYIGGKRVTRSAFLQYKYLAEQSGETRRAWYEPSHREKLDAFFEETDWSKIDSRIERLPYLARHLERNTPRIKATPVKDSKLFRFARERIAVLREAISVSGDERAAVSKVCRKYLDKLVYPGLAARYIVALGKRKLLRDLLSDHIEENTLEAPYAEWVEGVFRLYRHGSLYSYSMNRTEV